MELVYPHPRKIGVQVLNIDISKIDLLDIEKIKQLVYDYKLVIFRNQSLDNSQLICLNHCNINR